MIDEWMVASKRHAGLRSRNISAVGAVTLVQANRNVRVDAGSTFGFYEAFGVGIIEGEPP